MAVDRLTSAMLVGVLVRRAAAAGGFATVLVKGDETSGVILIEARERGEAQGLFERVPDFAGNYVIQRCGPAPDSDANVTNQYIERRRRADPDLWIVELDIAEAERFAAETIC